MINEPVSKTKAPVTENTAPKQLSQGKAAILGDVLRALVIDFLRTSSGHLRTTSRSTEPLLSRKCGERDRATTKICASLLPKDLEVTLNSNLETASILAAAATFSEAYQIARSIIDVEAVKNE